MQCHNPAVEHVHAYDVIYSTKEISNDNSIKQRQHVWLQKFSMENMKKLKVLFDNNVENDKIK